jgi:hypothetical protein
MDVTNVGAPAPYFSFSPWARAVCVWVGAVSMGGMKRVQIASTPPSWTHAVYPNHTSCWSRGRRVDDIDDP